MIVKGVSTNPEEIKDLRGFLPGSRGAELLAKVSAVVKELAMKDLMNPTTGIEGIRFAQGVVFGLEDFESRIRTLITLDLESYKEEGIDAEEDDDSEVVDVGY